MTKSTKKPRWIIGIDEVGRGPLAGPVTVCAVAIHYDFYKKARWVGLTDSKKLSPQKREVWCAKAKLLEKEGVIRIALASKTATMIDAKGISVCITSCIAICLKKLAIEPHDAHVLLDGGLKAPKEYIYQETVIQGDQVHKAISLASVVAKVTRDAYMTKMDHVYPGYDWEHNKGYGTKNHYKALKKLYITSLHRKSFLSRNIDI
jgi:ribonuclease HII